MASENKPSLWRSIITPGVETYRQGGWKAVAMLALNVVTGNWPGVAMQLAANVVNALSYKQKTAEDAEKNSPTYGLRMTNQTKGDTALPVVYSNDAAASNPGHPVAPVYLAAFTTPKGYKNPDVVRTAGALGQSVSILCAVAEGPIEDISDIRINDEPVHEVVTDRKPSEEPNGSRAQFTVPGERIELESVVVKVNGTSRGWTRTTLPEMVGTGTNFGTQVVYTIEIPSDAGGGQQMLDDSTDPVFYLGPAPTAAYRLTPNATAALRPMSWIADDGKLVVYTQNPIPPGQKLWVDIPVRRMSGIRLVVEEARLKITFTVNPVPAATDTVRVSYRRRLLRGMSVTVRRGGAAQLPIDGFGGVRNTTTKSITLIPNDPQSAQTAEACDDVVIEIAALQGLFEQQTDGGKKPRTVSITIDWRVVGASTYTKLRDPSSTGAADRYRFDLTGDAPGGRYWAFSIRNLLKRWLEKNQSDAVAAAELRAMGRNFLEIRVTRVSPNPSSDLVFDALTLWSITSVIDERTSYPGTALLAFHGVASPRLQGSLPRITCRVQGKRDVEVYSGGAWTASPTAQSNPVWAAIDFITNARYGSGQHYTKAANIDTTSAVLAAAWCDASVSDGKGGTEKRAILDYVADTRKSVLEQVRDMLAPAHVIPVLRGSLWTFVIDQPVTLADCVTLYDDGSSGSMLAGTLTSRHGPVTSKVSELQTSFLDRESDWNESEFWVGPESPASVRRVERVAIWGVTRRSQAERYSRFLYSKLTTQGIDLAWAMTPAGLRLEAGDVVRVVSTRLGIDCYARIMSWEMDSTESMIVSVAAGEYVPSVYGQSRAASSRGATETKKLAVVSVTTTKSDGSGVREPVPAPVVSLTRAA